MSTEALNLVAGEERPAATGACAASWVAASCSAFFPHAASDVAASRPTSPTRMLMLIVKLPR